MGHDARDETADTSSLDALFDESDGIADDDAVALLSELYGIEGRVIRLAGERDDNFRVEVAGEQRSLFLKVAHTAESRRVTGLQTALLVHLENDPAVPVARVVRTVSGGADGEFVLPDGSTRVARLTTFLPGSSLHDVALTADLRIRIGSTLARLTRALADFEHPAADDPQLWDIARAGELAPLISEIQDAGVRAVLTELLDRFRERVAPALPSLRRQVVHNDFSADNLRTDGTGVSGILDFGDACRTAIAADLAVAAAYQLRDAEDVLVPGLQVFRGYHAVHPLQDTEAAVLFELIVARMLTRLTITHWRAERFPGNRDYILRYAPRSLRVTRRLQALPPAAATAAIHRALEETER